MKSTRFYTLFAFLLMAGGVSMQAQECFRETRNYHPLIPESGERQWDVKNVFIWGDVEYQVMRLGEEIELDGVSYREMTYEDDGFSYSTGLMGAFREEDKKVYVRWWDSGLLFFNDEKVYYDFNLEVGDWFDVGYYEPAYIQVIAIEEVTLEDGSARNKFVFNDGWEGREEWIEGIGSLSGVHRRFDPGLASSSFSFLRCYYEEEVLTWTDGECWDDVEEVATEKVGLYPNPANGFAYVEGVIVSEVQVYNALGQMVKVVQCTNEITVAELPQGIYLLRIEDAEGRIFMEEVMVR